jgi:hypothetical protein
MSGGTVAGRLKCASPFPSVCNLSRLSVMGWTSMDTFFSGRPLLAFTTRTVSSCPKHGTVTSTTRTQLSHRNSVRHSRRVVANCTVTNRLTKDR